MKTLLTLILIGLSFACFGQQDFQCATIEPPFNPQNFPTGRVLLLPPDTICWAIFLDRNIQENFGFDSLTAVNWVKQGFVIQQQIYAISEIPIKISQFILWHGSTDLMSSTTDCIFNLYKLRDSVERKGTWQGDVLIGLDKQGGICGVAQTVAGLNSNHSTGYHACYVPLSNYTWVNPLVAPYTWTWNIDAWGHEVGHILGMYHSHSCVFSVGALDNYYTTEGGCPAGEDRLTGNIGSYGQLSSEKKNFTMGFDYWSSIAGGTSNYEQKNMIWTHIQLAKDNGLLANCTATPPPPTCTGDLLEPNDTKQTSIKIKRNIPIESCLVNPDNYKFQTVAGYTNFDISITTLSENATAKLWKGSTLLATYTSSAGVINVSYDSPVISTYRLELNYDTVPLTNKYHLLLSIHN